MTMSTEFESSVYIRERVTPWARMSLVQFMKEMAYNERNNAGIEERGDLMVESNHTIKLKELTEERIREIVREEMKEMLLWWETWKKENRKKKEPRIFGV
jgi:hypothetical protein